ncbi:MAG TPA: NosD domain-containing protein [Vicinamibacterales bacterium]|nr:NosD domain-containing protein [Vicinamibacterales bacterium]
MTILVAAVTLSAQREQPTGIVPTAGMVISESTRIRPGTYRLTSRDLSTPAITVRENDVVLDLTGVTLEGGESFGDPDRYTGVGILIDGGRNVTIRGGAIRGFKVGVLARKTLKLHITGGDYSYNWKPRLLSGIEHENAADWLSYHQNEKDEWLRYGAGLYLSECDTCEIDNNRAVQGQNALLITKSTQAKIWNNTFSWMSGLGIGMYRTTDSRVMHNRLDYDVRGYSHGFYNRGQDSAGLLMFEQTSRNTIAYNSITHGGDGVFLWAGQSTMDTGQGGANNNVFYDNDVSSAVANGFEVTFSRNTILNNRIEDCWHGIWGGYSYETAIDGNRFGTNTDAIAIEHGQDIWISHNTFVGDETAIRVWANTTQDPNWGYPKTRDTRSHGYTIDKNTFTNVKTALNVMRTDDVEATLNKFSGVGNQLDQGPAVTGLNFERPKLVDTGRDFVGVSRLPGAMNAMLPDGARRGRATIIVDDWGPFDYLSPKLWPSGKPTDRPLKLRVLGPDGKWTVKSLRGATASATSGVVPGEIVLTTPDAGADLNLELEYRGARVVTPRGHVFAAGAAVPMTYTLFDPAIDWTMKFWKFDASSDPLKTRAGFDALLATAPARTDHLSHLDFANARAFGDGFADHIGVRADGEVTLPDGAYDLSITSDDGIRVWLDDKMVLEDWSIHGAKEDHLALAGGRHRLRLEYFQNTGAATLEVIIRRSAAR